MRTPVIVQPNVQYCPGCSGWFDEMMLPLHGECAEPWGQGPVMAVLVGDSFSGSGPVAVLPGVVPCGTCGGTRGVVGAVCYASDPPVLLSYSCPDCVDGFVEAGRDGR